MNLGVHLILQKTGKASRDGAKGDTGKDKKRRTKAAVLK